MNDNTKAAPQAVASVTEEQLCEIEHAVETLRQITGGTSVVADTIERVSDIRRARTLATIAHRRLSAVAAALAQTGQVPAARVKPNCSTKTAAPVSASAGEKHRE